MEILVLKRNREVVFIAEDGHAWGRREIDDSDFAIIRVPDAALGGVLEDAQVTHTQSASARSVVTRGPGGFALRRPSNDIDPLSLPSVVELHGRVPDGD
jgi:hypothetical protein